MKRWLSAALLALAASAVGTEAARAAEPLPPADARFAAATTKEVPDFQRHVLPLLGRLGCNGRACHGSFQGQGGFRLSLFGYDFATDHEALLKGDEPRTNLQAPLKSLILTKPTLAVEHEGGRRLNEGTWQYQLLRRWIEAGAPKQSAKAAAFDRLEVSPTEILFKKPGEKIQLKVLAFWTDGSSEVVTPLCRFRTNDESKVDVDENGLVSCLGPGDTHVVAFYENGVFPVQTLLPVSNKAGSGYPNVPTPTEVDRLVVQKLKKLGVVPSEVCSDEEFLRRVSLDMTGTLPAPGEIAHFISDRSPDKRARKVDELLERPEYAAWWATRLCDVVGANSGQMDDPYFAKQMAVQWYDWIRVRLEKNVPYDEIVEGMVLAVSRKPDESYLDFAVTQGSYFRKENPADFSACEQMPYFWMRRNVKSGEEKALAFSYAFLGVRLQCAQCHKHPFDQWTQDDFKHFQAFFNAVGVGVRPDGKEDMRKLEAEFNVKGKSNAEKGRMYAEAVEAGKPAPFRELFVNANILKAAEPKKGKGKGNTISGRVITPKVLGGDEIVAAKYADPREPLMEWMRSPENPYFARSIVNRVWANYFGIGIIEPADDLNLANPPSNEALLDYLTSEFVKHEYDLKWLHREIANSRTYQLGFQTNDTNEFDDRNFARSLPRRLPAEVTYDAIVAATRGDSGSRASFEDRMIGPASGNIGRANQGQNYAMTVFGKPVRQTNCDCERSNEPSLLQTVFLRNDKEVLGLLERNGGWIAAVRTTLERESAQKERDAAAKKKLDERAAVRGKEKAKGKGDDESAADRPKALRAEVKELEAQIAKLTAAGKAEQAQRAQTRLDHLKEQVKKEGQEKKAEKRDAQGAEMAARADKNAPKGQIVVASTKPDDLVREAFLRTLSRYPTRAEATKAATYLAESPSTADGLRDLMWALLNTKEFIINH